MIGTESYHRPFVTTNRGKWHYGFLLVIILLSLGLGLHQLVTNSLWLDEIVSALHIREPRFSDVLDNLMGHSGRPLHSLIIYLFAFLGRGEFFLRLPSVMAGTLAVVLVYKVGEILFGRKEGLVAALLLALSPLHIHYMQEARPYALFMTFSLLSLYCFLQAWRSGKWHWWGAFAASTILNTYTHYFSIFVLIAELITGGIWILFDLLSLKADERWLRRGLWDQQRQRLIGLSLSLLMVGLAFVPSLSHLQAFLNKQGGGAAIATGLNLSVPFFVQVLAQLSVGQKTIDSAIWLFGALFLLGLIVSGLKRQIKALWLILIWMVLPFLILFIVPSRHFFDIRYVIFILPIFHLVVARGLTGPGELLAWLPIRREGFRTMTRNVWVILVLVLVLLTVRPIAQYYAWEKEDWRAAASYLRTHIQPGDLIICDGARLTQSGADGERPYKALAYYLPEAFQDQIVILQPQSAEAIKPLAEGERGVWGIVYGHLKDWNPRDQPVTVSKFQSVTVFGTQDASGTVLDKGILLSQVLLNVLRGPARLDVNIALGQLYDLRGDHDLASEQYNQALSLVSDPMEAAAIYRELGDLEKAKASYLQVLAANNRAHAAHFGLGSIYEEMGRPDLALEEYKQASQLSPQHAGYHARMGQMYTQLGELDLAERSLLQAIELDPQSAWDRVLLANVLLAQGKAEEAVGVYEQALALNPGYQNNAWVQLHRGHAYRLAGRIEEAIATYEQVLALDADNAQAAQWLAELK